jgi:hypothetical protein
VAGDAGEGVGKCATGDTRLVTYGSVAAEPAMLLLGDTAA